MTASEQNLRDKLVLKTPGGEINYSVVAGAGAGKSTMLSKRIARQISKGESLDSFVIITYTNAAANELRDKLADELKALLDEPISAEEKEYAKEALSKIELIRISTIHSFLLQILKEHAFESRLTLDSEMYEDDDETKREEAFFNKWLADPVHFAELSAFRNDWNITSDKGRTVDYTRTVLWNAFSDIASLREDVVLDLTDHSAEFEKAAKDYVDSMLIPAIGFRDALIKNNPPLKSGKPRTFVKIAQTIIDDVTVVEAAVSGGAYGIDEACLLSDAHRCIKEKDDERKADPKASFFNREPDDSVLDPFIPSYPADELTWNFRKYYEDFLYWSLPSARIIDYACKIRDAYQAETDTETRFISNDDILYRAEKLITDYPEILEELRKRFTKIYVDEFQDTTLCQARIVELLAGKTGSTASSFDPKENNLLVVGDPKQSIYRFTGAEKAVYDKVNSDISSLPNALAEAVTLESNFRSNSDIVEWVNDKFGKYMPSYIPMASDRMIAENEALHGVYSYTPSEDLHIEKYDVPSDAYCTVDLIKTLVSDDKFFIEEYDSKEEKHILRRPVFSDFMVITRNARDISAYVDSFAAENIPLNVQGKVSLAGDEVVRNYVRILSYFADSKNEAVKITAAQIAGRCSASKDDESILKAGEDILKNLLTEFRKENLTAASITRKLLNMEELYLPERPFDMPGVKKYRARLNQMVEACLSECEGDLSELVSIMETYVSSEIKKENALESGENAVRLMNVHQAKGLTGGIVIIANRKNDESPRYGGFKSMGKYYPSASYKAGEMAAVTIRPSYGHIDTLRKQAETEEKEESIRLEYVAATRAAHAMIFMPECSSNKNIWFSENEFELDSLPDIGAWMNGRLSDTKTYPLKPFAVSSHTLKKLADFEGNLASADMDAVNAAASESVTPSSLEPEGVTGYTLADPGYTEETDRPHGNIFGTVMHRVYELIFARFDVLKGLNTADRSRAIKRIVNQVVSEQLDEMHAGDSPAEFAAYLENKMGDYFDKVIIPIMDSAEEVYPEYSFSFYVPKSELADFKARFAGPLLISSSKKELKTDNIWVNGQADLVVKQKDGSIKVYDYKSDARSGKELKLFEVSLEFKYKGQLDLYKYAIGKAFGVSEVATEIIHLYK